MGKRKKSKYSGKAMDIAFREAMSGVEAKEDKDLFFEDKDEEDMTKEERIKRTVLKRSEQKKAFKTKKSIVEACKVEKMANKAQARKSTNSNKKKQQGPEVYDIWGESNDLAKKQDKDEWIVPRSETVRTKKIKKMHATPSTDHKVAPVKVAHPGASYNPKLEDFQEGYAKTVQEATVFEERKKLNDPLLEAILERRKARKLAGGEEDVEEDYDEEENSGEDDDDEEQEEEEEEEEEKVDDEEGNNKDDDGLPSWRKKLQPGERITRVRRNKEKRKRETDLELQRKKAEKRKLEQIENADVLQKELEEEEQAIEDRIKTKKQRLDEKLLRDPALKSSGKVVKRMPQIASILPSDLTENMRTLKPHAGLIMDRYHSLHTRNKFDAPKDEKQRRKIAAFKMVPVGKVFLDEGPQLPQKRDKSERGTKPQKKQRNRVTPSGKVYVPKFE